MSRRHYTKSETIFFFFFFKKKIFNPLAARVKTFQERRTNRNNPKNFLKKVPKIWIQHFRALSKYKAEKGVK